MRSLIRLLCLLAVGQALWLPHLAAQTEPDEPIFRRFSAPPRRADGSMRLFEIPVALRPQTDPGAEVDENLGLVYEVSSFPFKRIFLSTAAGVARMAWRPSDVAAASAEVLTFDLSQSVNFRIGRHFIVAAGLGVGVLDSLVVNEDSTFEHHTRPTISLRLGAMLNLWDSWFFSLRAMSTPYLSSQGHVTGHSRLLVGAGWSY